MSRYTTIYKITVGDASRTYTDGAEARNQWAAIGDTCEARGLMASFEEQTVIEWDNERACESYARCLRNPQIVKLPLMVIFPWTLMAEYRERPGVLIG